MFTLRFHLACRDSFWFEDLIFAHGWLHLLPYEWDAETKTLSRSECLTSGKMVRLGVRSPAPGAAAGGIDVEMTTVEPLSDAEEAELHAGLRRAFVLEERFEAWWDLCSAEPGLQRASHRRQGRMLRSPSLFEDLVKTVCTINTTWAQTQSMVANLVQHFGPGDRPDGATCATGRRGDTATGGTGGRGEPTYPLPSPRRPVAQVAPSPRPRPFPTAEALAAVDVETLRERARVGYRAETLSGLARAVVEGRLDLERLQDQTLPDEPIVETLRALRGFGPYAVAHVLMLLGRYDFLPVDSWLRRTVSDAWFSGRALTDREIVQAFERFRPYRALAYHFFDWQGADRRDLWTEPSMPA